MRRPRCARASLAVGSTPKPKANVAPCCCRCPARRRDPTPAIAATSFGRNGLTYTGRWADQAVQDQAAFDKVKNAPRALTLTPKMPRRGGVAAGDGQVVVATPTHGGRSQTPFENFGGGPDDEGDADGGGAARRLQRDDASAPANWTPGSEQRVAVDEQAARQLGPVVIKAPVHPYVPGWHVYPPGGTGYGEYK